MEGVQAEARENEEELCDRIIATGLMLPTSTKSQRPLLLANIYGAYRKETLTRKSRDVHVTDPHFWNGERERTEVTIHNRKTRGSVLVSELHRRELQVDAVLQVKQTELKGMHRVVSDVVKQSTAFPTSVSKKSVTIFPFPP